MIARLPGLIVPLLALAAGVVITLALLAESRRLRRQSARDLEHAIRPSVALDDELLRWCCERSFLTHGLEHEDGRPCSR